MKKRNKKNKNQNIEKFREIHTYTREKGNRNKGKRISISVGTLLVVIMLLLGLFAFVFYKNKQSSEITGTTAKQSDETNAEARATSYNIYGEQPFTEEYSIGAFVSANTARTCGYGTGFSHTGKSSDGQIMYVGTNTSKSNTVYRDVYDGFEMGTKKYDVRTYFWLIEGDDYCVIDRWSYAGEFCAIDKNRGSAFTFPDGYETENVPTVIGLEFHFYEAGTLATNKPVEVSVKGIGSFSDLDRTEGFSFLNGVNSSTEIYLSSDTTIAPGPELSSLGIATNYTTSINNAWLGTVDNEDLASQIIYYQFQSSASSPLSMYYYGYGGYASYLQSSTNTVTYHIIGDVPSGVTYPKDPIYVATYGTYTIMDELSAAGYTFTGWNKDSINGTNVSGDTISPITSNIDVYGEFTMSVSVKKTWADSNNQDGIRPSSVTVTLYNNGSSTGKTLTLRSLNNWSGTFTNLDVSDNYSVVEQSVSGYTASVTGSATSGFTITNTHTPETISIPVSKTWSDNSNQDGKRPTSVTVTLYANGISTGKTLTLNSFNSWKGTFSNVAKNSSGRAITYTVQENSVSGYTNSITGNATSGFTITNTHTPETISIPVSKTWSDSNNQDGKRPTSVTVILYANGTSTGKTITLNSSNSWKGTFSDVNKYSAGREITYTVQENAVSGYTASITGSATSGFTITNTHTPETTSVTATKIWNHTNNEYTIPTEVKIQVKNGSNVVAEKILNSSNKTSNENTWQYTFTNLPKYQNGGQEINYTIGEVEVNTGDLKYYNQEINGTTIRNTFNGPIIRSSKEIKTENNLAYVVEGEKITYTIRVQNSGGLAQNVVIKDSAPEGTTFVNGSIKINGTIDTSKTSENLANGITVNVPATGEATVSFDVTVNNLAGNTLTKIISNTATVNKNPEDSTSPDDPTNEVTTTVNKAALKYNKSSNPASGSTVKKGDEITYTIHLDNTEGKAPTTAVVKDNIPEGSTFVAGSIKIGGVSQANKTANDLKNGISVELGIGESKDIEFKVTVNDINNGDTIRNVATVNDNPTNEIEHNYIEAVITSSKEIKTANNLNYVVEGEKITYTIRVQNSGGLAQNVVIKDSAPEGTTFVNGSIKINGTVDTSKTSENLANGITVNVPATGEATVSFDVTVNNLVGNTLTKTISNTATVNKNPDDPTSPDEPTNEVTTTVNKANLKYSKSSNPASGSTVKKGDEITYTIHLDNTEGKAPTTAVVKDNIPEGTTFVTGSIKIGGEAQASKTAEDLRNGISINVGAGESKNVEFKVTVNDIEDEATIRNIATVNDNTTNETEHKYAEAILTASKEIKTEKGLNYVVEGEKITYTIKVQNSGSLAQNVVIKDSAPEGTTFVNGSIKINGAGDTSKTSENLANGITINVPSKQEVSLSFDVTVNNLAGNTLTKTISNTATVNKNSDDPTSPDEPTNEVTTTVNKANLKYSKSSNPASGSTVKVGDEITYTIHLDNTEGKAPTTAVVKDNIPEGTTFVAGSIKIGGVSQANKTANDLQNGISVELGAGESKNVEFKVTVNDINNGDIIRNVATVNDNPTNETEHNYVEAVVSAVKEMVTENGLDYVEEGEKVTYTIRVQNSGSLAQNVVIKDSAPEGTTFVNGSIKINGAVDTNKTAENLANGIIVNVPSKQEATVSFEVTVNNLEGNTLTKTISNTAIVNKNPADSTSPDEPTNEVTTEVKKANIVASKESDPTSGSKVKEGDEITYRIKVRNNGTKEGQATIKDNIPEGTTFVDGSIKIDNTVESNKTATDLQNGITINVTVGQERVVEFKVTVNKLADGTKIKNTAYISQNGEDQKVPEEPEHTYVEPKEEQSIVKTGTTKIENLDDEITYNIVYNAKITDYEGKAKVKVVDSLPYAIDEAKSDIAGGTYDEASRTITWEETVEDIKITEEKEVSVNKTIRVVYKDISQDVLNIKNIVTGHIEYETPNRTSDDVTGNWTTTTGFIVNIPVSKIWEDEADKLGQRPTKVVFKLHGSDGNEYTKELARPGTQGSTTTQDSSNSNKWNDIFVDLPKYDNNNQEIEYTLTEEEKTEGELKYYDSVVTDKTVTNTNKYGKVTVHYYIMNTDGTLTTTRVPDTAGVDTADVVIEGKVGTPYTTEEASNVNEKYELVTSKLPENSTGTIEKYNEESLQEVIYYYRLKPAKVVINYLEKDSNQVLSTQERMDGHVDDTYNTNTAHRKETIQKDGRTYTLVEDSGNTEGTMTVADTKVTYYYLQNTKATVRYVARNPETGNIEKDLEEPTTQEGLVGDKFVTNEKAFIGYRLVESPTNKTITMTKEEQTLIYYYEPVYTGLIENHIDDKTGRVLYTEEHQVQVGTDYNIPSKEFEGYDLVESKLPSNSTGTMGEELVTVNYYYIKKAVLEVNYIDIYTNEPLTEQIVDNTKHEGDEYTTEQKEFENYDLVEVPSNASGTMEVTTDEEGNITDNKTVVTYYYTKRAAGVEEHHIDILTGKDIEEPTIHNGHVGDEYNISSKEFLSYELVTEDEDGNSMLPTNSVGIMNEEKIVVNYYYNQPAKVVVHYVEKETGKELEETNPETGESQSSQVVIEGFNQDEYETIEKEFKYYTLIESPENETGKMNVEITTDEEGNKIVNNTIDVYYYYKAKPFNIGVEKEITGIIVNGERREATNGKLEKLEIYRKDVEKTSVQVEYKLKVSNTGEVEGAVTIEDKLPEGMSLATNDENWEEEGNTIGKLIPEINPGETKEYTVLLNWNTAENNMGEKDNELSIVDTQNVPGFVDNNEKDNTANATVIIAVATGEQQLGLTLVLVALVVLEAITLRYAVVVTKKQKGQKIKTKRTRR